MVIYITPKLNWIYIYIFEAAPILLLLEANILSSYTESFWNIIAGLYSIRLVVGQADPIFRDLIPCYLAF